MIVSLALSIALQLPSPDTVLFETRFDDEALPGWSIIRPNAIRVEDSGADAGIEEPPMKGFRDGAGRWKPEGIGFMCLKGILNGSGYADTKGNAWGLMRALGFQPAKPAGTLRWAAPSPACTTSDCARSTTSAR